MKTAFLLLLLLAALPVLGQAALPVDEQGKVVFYEVVNTEGLPKEVLYARALGWLAEQTTDWKEESGGDGATYRFTANRHFPVYAKGYVSKQLHGTISYRLTLEIKDNRYRYYCNDLVFHYYQIDRTYKMVPTGKTKPLEDQKAPGWQQTWKSHRETTVKTMTALAANLKDGLQKKAANEEKIAKSATITETW